MTTNTWSGSGNWQDAARWSLGHKPTTTEDAVLTGSGTIDDDETLSQCKSLTATSFTGSINHRGIAIYGPGTLALGAGGDYTNFRPIIRGAVTVDANGHRLSGIVVNSGVSGSLTLLAALALDQLDVDDCAVALGAFDLTVGVVLALGITAATAWTWGAGKLKIEAATTVIGSSSKLATPSMPPVVMLGTADLTQGDIRVASIDETSFTLTRNGNTVFDASNNPILPPAPPATDTTWTGAALDGLWATAGNWNHGVPDGTLDVIIGGSDTITVGGSINLKSLDLSGFTGQLSGNNTLRIDVGDGSTAASGTVAINASQIAIGGLGRITINVKNNHDATLLGSVVLTNGIWYGNGATVRIGVTGAIDDIDQGPGFNASAAIVLLGNITVTNYIELEDTVTFNWGTRTITFDVAVSDEPFFEIIGNGISYSGGAAFNVITHTGVADTELYLTTGTGGQSTFPPITVSGDGSVKAFTDVLCGSFTLTAGQMDLDGSALLSSGAIALNGGTLIGLAHNTVSATTFASNGVDLIGTGGQQFSLNVTGSNVASNCTITYCLAGITTLTATSSIDGGNNTNVDFVVTSHPAGCLLML